MYWDVEPICNRATPQVLNTLRQRSCVYNSSFYIKRCIITPLNLFFTPYSTLIGPQHYTPIHHITWRIQPLPRHYHPTHTLEATTIVRSQKSRHWASPTRHNGFFLKTKILKISQQHPKHSSCPTPATLQPKRVESDTPNLPPTSTDHPPRHPQRLSLHHLNTPDTHTQKAHLEYALIRTQSSPGEANEITLLE